MGLRILHVIDSLEPEAGSIALGLHGLTGVLAARDVEPVLICSSGGQGEPGDPPGSCEVRVFNRANYSDLVRGCEAVHIHGWGFEAGQVLAKDARRQGRSYFITPCGALTEGRYRHTGLGERVRGWLGGDAVVRGAAGLLAQNRFEAASLHARTARDRVHTLSYGLDFGDFVARDPDRTNVGNTTGDRTLLVLAPVEPVYGGVPLLKALAELGEVADGWRLVFAGRAVGDWRKQMEAAVRRKGGADRVTFSGARGVDAQRTWLDRASVLASVGLHVHSPMSIVQALARGVPALTTDLVAPDGLDQVMRVCSADRASIRTGLHDMFALSDDERNALGMRGRDAARALLDWKHLIDRYLELYERAGTRAGAPATAAMA